MAIKHFPTKSDVYAIPVERIANISNEPDVFDYSSWFASQSWQVGDPINPYGEINITGGSEITDPAQRSYFSTLNLEPFNKILDSSPVIRYLYTGREYNMETGDYYYRARMMDSSIGRFGSKDPILYLNLYRYVGNNPMRFRDRFGRDPDDGNEDWEDIDYYIENWGSASPTYGLAAGTLSDVSCQTIGEFTGQSFVECLHNCETQKFNSRAFAKFIDDPLIDDEAQQNMAAITGFLIKLTCFVECMTNRESYQPVEYVDKLQYSKE